MKLALLTALLLCAAAARADDGDPNSLPTTVDDQAPTQSEDMRRQLEEDPGLQRALAERILRSRIGDTISGQTDGDKKREEIMAWIKSDPNSASAIALGLARDDATGTHKFESGIVKSVGTTYHRNDNVNRGAMGVLKGAAKTSKLMKLDENEGVGEEERRELLKSLFEGKGAQTGKTITGSAPDPKTAPGSGVAPSASFANSFYDRLSAGNIRGYSPQLMAFQSSLNQRRPPGAPALIETGKLDYATLSYPAYGLRFDLGNLEERMRRSRLAELATMAGVRLSERDLKDPGFEAKLLAKVPADKLPKHFASRNAAIERARAALAAFEDAAARAKDPNQITKGLLIELSGKQREAARWLTAASLEEELARIEQEEGFLTAELLAMIDAVPAPPAARENYKRRGEAYKERLAKLKSNCLASLEALRADDWAKRIGEIDKMTGENSRLRGNLSRDISDYRLVPLRIGEAVLTQPRWRELLDNLLVRYASSTSYGRAVANRRGKLSRFLGIFDQVASGDIEGAHLSLVNAEGGRR